MLIRRVRIRYLVLGITVVGRFVGHFDASPARRNGGRTCRVGTRAKKPRDATVRGVRTPIDRPKCGETCRRISGGGRRPRGGNRKIRHRSTRDDGRREGGRENVVVIVSALFVIAIVVRRRRTGATRRAGERGQRAVACPGKTATKRSA